MGLRTWWRVLSNARRDNTPIDIEMPPVHLQRDCSRRAAAIDTLKAAHRESLAQLDALFASLQHRAFREEL